VRYKLAALAVSVLACALVLWPPRPARNDLRITFIDVGQADAILIQTPRGHAIMIDTGGRLERNESGDGGSMAESVGEKVVVAFLIRQGIHHVDAILLTHPHGDHKDFRAHEARALINSSLHDFQNLAAAWRTHSRNHLWAVSALSRGCHAIL
jgi:beta-lactamase superfamily II metal-dependent hydrolase